MKHKKKKNTVVCLIGPTAVGKTEVAVALAKRINAEIISCDSMQIYRGIDIASSKPTKRQIKAVPHHFIDIVSPSRQYNAALFKAAAQRVIRELHKRGKIPLITAGTGLYFHALISGLFKGPGQDSKLRKKLYQQAQKQGAATLYKRLQELDAQTAKTVHPHDLRRIVRALEVFEACGIKMSKLKEKTCGIKNRYDIYIFGLQRKRDQLYARIEDRVDRMFKRGLLAEIRKLNQHRISRTAKSLLGYKEINGFLNGEYPCTRARELLKRNTRRYAKRQLSWFRREKGVKWIELNRKNTPESVAKKICSFLV